MKGFRSAAPGRGKRDYMKDVADIIEWPTDGQYLDVRMIGPVFSIKNIWFTIATEQNPKQRISRMCIDHDGENDAEAGDFCPYRKSGLGNEGKEYWVNVIVRDLQLNDQGNVKQFPNPKTAGYAVEEHLGHRAFWAKKGDTRKTPVRLLQIPESQVDKLKNLSKSNKTKDGQWHELSDDQFGCDIGILSQPKNSKVKGAAKFDIQKRDKTPIQKEEKYYLLYRPDLLKMDTVEVAKAELENIRNKLAEDDDKPARPASRGGGTAARRPSQKAQEADDELVDMSAEDLGDLENEAPAPAARRPARPAPAEELDDMDGTGDPDLDADLADLDDPKPAGRRPAAAQGRRPAPVDPIDELDADGGAEPVDEFGDDPADEPAPRRPAARPAAPAPAAAARRPAAPAARAPARRAPATVEEDF